MDVPDETFTGFPDEAMDFFVGLTADNSRTYWTAHHDRYERAVRGPMLALMAAMEPEFGPGKMFRPHRDLRFGKDRTPYKTQAAALLTGPDGRGSFYLHISADGLTVGAGYYSFAPDQLARYRAAVLTGRTGEQLRTLTDALREGGSDLLSHARLTRAPRGVDPEHPRIGLLRLKGLAVGRDLGTPPWLSAPECREHIAEIWREYTPLTAWLDRQVGPAEPD
jgi:uncharacterized protein (TIGR02453 family)